MFLDVCLGASAEDTYEFGRYAKYMIAAPGNIPAAGTNYKKLLGGITAATTVQTLGIKAVNDFKAEYNEAPSYVNKYLSFYKTDKIGDIKNAVDDLANLLLAPENADQSTAIKTQLLAPPLGLSPITASYSKLVDLGFLAEIILDYSKPEGENSWPELWSAAASLKGALSASMIRSWSNQSDYHKYEGDAIPYGLTISWANHNNWNVTWYTALQFGGGKWGELLDYWF
jgi:hypothetical protein